MDRDTKTAVVEEIASELTASEAVFAIDYRGITVTEIAELRSKLRESDAAFRVVKNRLTKLAADRADTETIKQFLEGPTALTLIRGDIALAAKALAQFTREHQKLEFKGGLMNGEEIDAEQIRQLSRLPGREVLNAQLAGIVASPLTGLVRGLNSLIAGLAISLRQIADQGLVGGDAPAEEPPAEEPPAEEPPAEEPAAEEEAGEPEPEPDQETETPEAEAAADDASEPAADEASDKEES